MTIAIEERTIQEARFVLENNTTIRESAKHFGISKSTLHSDLSKRLKQIDVRLYNEVHAHLQSNFSVRHIRGGEATRQKYKNNYSLPSR
jgi:Stage III sporulation protein D.